MASLVASVVAAVLLLGWLAYAEGLVVRQEGQVAVPPVGAGPRQVVKAFVAALDAHDCATARKLFVDRRPADQWCGDVLSLKRLRMRTPFAEKPQWSGHRSDQEVMDVGVTFDLRWRLFHNDGSMEEGPTTWGYTLVRDSARQPWRIADQGTG